MTSCVVALHTVLDTAEPVTLCCAAVILSVMLWPDIFLSYVPKKSTQNTAWFYPTVMLLSLGVFMLLLAHEQKKNERKVEKNDG